MESSGRVSQTVPGFAFWATFEGDTEGFRPLKVMVASTVFKLGSISYQYTGVRVNWQCLTDKKERSISIETKFMTRGFTYLQSTYSNH